jgi:hypothetical protein
MRPYGLELTLIAGPDVADIQAQARKSSAGRTGGAHGYIRSSAAKRAARVSIKRGARAKGRAEIARELADRG